MGSSTRTAPTTDPTPSTTRGWTDYIQFVFSQDVVLGQLYTVVFGNDGDFEYWTNTTTGDYSGTGAPDVGGTAVENPSSGWDPLNGATSKYLLVGAEYFNYRTGTADRDDQFKIKKIYVTEPVPGPNVPDGGSTVALMGLAFLSLMGGKRALKRNR